MTTFYDNDLVEQWRTGKRKQPIQTQNDQSEATAERERNIFNREFKGRLLANGAKESLLARKILIEMYVDRLNKNDKAASVK